MNLYLGTALPRIREHYDKALQSAEREIAARRAALGPKLTDVGELRRFVEWASQPRNRIARQWRIPAGPGACWAGRSATGASTVRVGAPWTTCWPVPRSARV
jgi:hypothetical protein